MKLKECEKIIGKYNSKYGKKIVNIRRYYIENIIEIDKNKNLLKSILTEYRNIVKKIVYEIVDEIKEIKKIRFCVTINGSLVRGTNTLFSDIDLNYFYDNKYRSKMIKYEEIINYIIQEIMKFRGKDRIHSMTVYLPLINNDIYEFLLTNKYPVKLDDCTIYTSCRENAEELMYKTYNSTRDIYDVINYFNQNDNIKNLNEWTNCMELVYDNGYYHIFLENRKICKDKTNICSFIDKLLNLICNDTNYIDENCKIIEVMKLKYYYKMLVFENVYNLLSICFRLNDDIKIINIIDFENSNLDLDHEFFEYFYDYLNYVQKLQLILDLKNIDLSFHSIIKVDINIINDIYFNLTKNKNIIADLNNSKKRLYKICEKYLKRKEDEFYE